MPHLLALVQPALAVLLLVVATPPGIPPCHTLAVRWPFRHRDADRDAQERPTFLPGGSATELSPTLPPAMDPYTFAFIGGLHHSGTSLMSRVLCTNPGVGCLQGTKNQENEGQHAQSVYPPINKLGGALRFAFYDVHHLTESSALVSEEARRSLFESWSEYWTNMDAASVLVEKSPPNLIKMRFLQQLFTREHSRFLVMMRHPFGSARLKLPTSADKELESCCSNECKLIVQHWLEAHMLALDDLAFLQPENVVFLKFEDFVQSRENATAAIRAVEDFLRLEHESKYSFAHSIDESLWRISGAGSLISDHDGDHDRRSAENASRQKEQQDLVEPQQQHQQQQQQRVAGGGRQLLGYHGSSESGSVSIAVDSAFTWLTLWRSIYFANPESCEKLINTYEVPLNRFGYSLRQPTMVGRAPQAFEDLNIARRYM